MDLHHKILQDLKWFYGFFKCSKDFMNFKDSLKRNYYNTLSFIILVVGETMAMPILTNMGAAAPTTALTITASMTQPEMGTFVPPFTAGVPMSTSIPASPNSQRFVTMHNLSREQLYGIYRSCKSIYTVQYA